MKWTERAACRIDLAGGTLDLWPLYLYFGGLELVNMAIKVEAEARFAWQPTRRKTHSISIRSHDLRFENHYDSLENLGASLNQNPRDNPLRWVNRVVFDGLSSAKSFGEWRIETSSGAPPGSGLGGSSTLGVALLRGIQKKLSRKRQDAWDLQQRVRDLEAVEIEHPAGDQDYVPALFGGLLIFKLGTHSRSVERLPDALGRKLSQQTALLYTGKPHHSGLNNWQIFKALHEGNKDIRAALGRIHEISAVLAADLRAKKLQNFAQLLNAEWTERQKLSPAVSAPVLDQAWRHAETLGATARKACGAGGGGCLLVYFPDASLKKKALEAPLPQASWKWLSTELAT